MNTLLRAALSGAAGAYLADLIEPQLAKAIPQTSDTMKKATHYGSIGIGTAGAWYLTGLVAK